MPNFAGKLAFPMLLHSRAPSAPWVVRMRPPIRATVGRTVLWLGLVVECLFLAAGLGGQVFGSASSGPYLAPVRPCGNWYDLCLHHLQPPPPTTIRPITILPIINSCLLRLGARHSIAFFASSSFPQHVDVGAARPAAPADAPQTPQASPSYQVILALDQTPLVH